MEGYIINFYIGIDTWDKTIDFVKQVLLNLSIKSLVQEDYIEVLFNGYLLCFIREGTYGAWVPRYCHYSYVDPTITDYELVTEIYLPYTRLTEPKILYKKDKD